MARVNAARHLCRATGNLDEKPDKGTLGAQNGLHRRATLPADRGHLDDAAVGINRHRRNDPVVGEENVIKLRHKLLEIGGWRASNSRLGGQFDEALIRSNAPSRSAVWRPMVVRE